MTSRSLYFKLMLEDLKRRVWTIALTLLAMMFSILVPVAIKCSEYADMISEWNATQVKRMTANIVELLGVNGFAIFFLMVAAVLWSVSGFQYLHNSRKVDFYHSIPVKRHVLFAARFLNGILIPGLAYLVFLVPAVLLAYNTGIDSKEIAMVPWQMFGINMVYYSLLYTVTVIAMMLTGNVVVALLGTGVFCGYVPAVTWLVLCYYSLWFHTYYETEEGLQEFYHVIRYSSPISNYMYALTDFLDDKPVLGQVAGAAAVAAVLAAAAYLIYRLRASEAAGKAMAFKKTRMPIKVLIVIPVALASGMIFFELRNTIAWLIFGTVCGVILVHCTMEIIYHFDFRKLFANKLHLAGCMVVSVVLALAGYHDWFGYDSWLPDGEGIVDTAVILSNQDDWVTYGKPSEPNENSGYIYWEYESGQDYKLEQMHLTDIYSVLELAKLGVEADAQLRAGQRTKDGWQRFIIRYRMDNGKVETRRYNIPVDAAVLELYDAVHDNPEYKLGSYPILHQTAADTSAIYYQQYNQVKELELGYEEMAHFLEVYQKEWKQLRMDTRRQELPVATIQFRTHKQQEAIDHNALQERYSSDLYNRCYYPIYPSFVHTLELLKQQGIVPAALDETTLSTVQLYYRDQYWAKDYELELTGMEGSTRNFKEDEDLRALGQALIYQDYHNMNSSYELDMVDNVDISASFRHETTEGRNGEASKANGYAEERYYGFYLDAGRLSQEQMEKYGLVNLEDEEQPGQKGEVVEVRMNPTAVNNSAVWY